MKPAAVVGWSGNGELMDLHRTASDKLSLLGPRVTTYSRSLLIEGADPVAVARRLAHLPGVSWVAVGYRFEGERGFLSQLITLARHYLRPGSTFSLRVRAEESPLEEGDLLLEGTGSVLKSVKGSQVDERSPGTVFRAVMVRGSGAVGVELRSGPGGVPTSRRARAYCLASGGYHSAVAAWMAALSGYSVTLVHARADDEALRQVARLYAELSHRIDASGLQLLLLEGGASAGERLSGWLAESEGDIFSGVHPECRGASIRKKFGAYPQVLLPLLLLSEEEMRQRLGALGIKWKSADASPSLVFTGRRSRFAAKHFGGKEADVNVVLDSLVS